MSFNIKHKVFTDILKEYFNATPISFVDGRYQLSRDELNSFASFIVDKCQDIVISSDPSEKMILHEPYSTILLNINENFFE